MMSAITIATVMLLGEKVRKKLLRFLYQLIGRMG
jgi:hypothetical protein